MPSFPQNLPVIVISLKNSPRRAYIKNHLDQLKIPFEFLDGIEGRQNLANPTLFSELLSNGEVGCFRSHLAVYEKIINSAIPYALIFEDDIQINSDEMDLFIAQLNWLISLYPKLRWEMIRLYRKHKKYPVTPIISNPPFSLNIQHKRTFMCAAYLMSQDGAKKFLDTLNKNMSKNLGKNHKALKKIYEPIDRYLDNIHRSKIKLLISDAKALSTNQVFKTESQANFQIRKNTKYKKLKDSIQMRWATWKLIRFYKKLLAK